MLEGLRHVVEIDGLFEVVGTAQSADEALPLLKQVECDVVVMDVSLEGTTSGIEATRQIKEQLPNAWVLMLSVHGETHVAEAIKAGADGYVMKTSGKDTLCRAIYDVYNGRSAIDPSLTRFLFESIADIPDASAKAQKVRQT